MFMRLPLLFVVAGDTSNVTREEGEPSVASIGAPVPSPVAILLRMTVLEEEPENAPPVVHVVSNVTEEGVVKGFGHLMALLEKIPSVYADHKVRTQLPT